MQRAFTVQSADRPTKYRVVPGTVRPLDGAMRRSHGMSSREFTYSRYVIQNAATLDKRRNFNLFDRPTLQPIAGTLALNGKARRSDFESGAQGVWDESPIGVEGRSHSGDMGGEPPKS